MTKYEVKLQFEVGGGDDSYPVVRFINRGGKPQKETFSYEFDDYLLKNATEIKEPKESVTYCMGDRFRMDDGDEYVIVQVSSNECLLVKSAGRYDVGNRYHDPAVYVESTSAITRTEFNNMCGDDADEFTKITD